MRAGKFAAVVSLVAYGAQGLSSVSKGGSFQAASELSFRTQLASLAEMEAEDTRFWGSEFDAEESALRKLEAVAARSSGGMAVLQTSAEPATNKTATATASVANVTKAASTANATKVHSKHAHDSAQTKEARAMSGVNLNPKSAADLAPTLAMLHGLYEDSRDRITALNAREKKNKKAYEDKVVTHNTRIAAINTKNKTLSVEFLNNETKDENRLFSYWERVRDRQHRQFHTSLKIQHGMMDKVKVMMDMYEKTMNGGADKKQVQKDLARVAGGAAPEIVFLQQQWRAVASFCQDALEEVTAVRTSTLEGVGDRKLPAGI